jgi:hypothetical protein
MDPETWASSVGKPVRDRRRELDIRSMRKAARVAGVSEAVWRQAETGQRQLSADIIVAPSFTADTKAALCRALGWTPGSIDRILAGEEPMELEVEPESPSQHSLAGLVTLLQDLAPEVGRLLEEDGRSGRPSRTSEAP